jgi:hypothetical protein
MRFDVMRVRFRQLICAFAIGMGGILIAQTEMPQGRGACRWNCERSYDACAKGPEREQSTQAKAIVAECERRLGICLSEC